MEQDGLQQNAPDQSYGAASTPLYSLRLQLGDYFKEGTSKMYKLPILHEPIQLHLAWKTILHLLHLQES